MLDALSPKQIEDSSKDAVRSSTFAGFKPPSSNTTYTPNQYFDVCIRHCSRGTVRLVGYLIRKTLGWCDKSGQPQEDQIRTSYTDLIENAGISRDMIRKALTEAVSFKFLDCLKSGRPSKAGAPARAAFHQLRWDSSHTYQKRTDTFDGFFEGEGNRTTIPNEFFDVVVATEKLAVIKVVGAIIRSSIGFEARRGHRRQNVALSYRALQNFTGIASKRTLHEAIQIALEKQYIVRLAEGVFSPDKSKRHSAVYAPCWADSLSGQNWMPSQSEKDTSQKRIPEIRSEKDTSTSPKGDPEGQSEKDTSIKTKQENETYYKSEGSGFLQKRMLLIGEEIDPQAADEIAKKHSLERIERQIGWIDARRPREFTN